MPQMLLIVEPIGQRQARGAEGGEIAYRQMLAFTEDLKQAGVLMASSSLPPRQHVCSGPRARRCVCSTARLPKPRR